MDAILRLLLVVTVAIPLFACGGPSTYMKTTTSLSTPDANSAVVRFVRPSRFVGSARDYALLDGEQAIGTLSNGAQFSYITTPGKHLFIAPGFGNVRPYFLEADLAPGKTYYVVVSSYQEDFSTRRVLLAPITPNTDQWKEVPTYDKDLTRLEPDRVNLEAWSALHRDEITRLLRNYHETWKHERQWGKIAPDDGV
jgi:hypothetical protein